MKKEEKNIYKKEIGNKKSAKTTSVSKNIKLLETQIDRHIDVFKRLKDK